MITVVANGRPVELPDGATLTALLDALDLHSARPLSDGDRIELVRAVAGG